MNQELNVNKPAEWPKWPKLISHLLNRTGSVSTSTFRAKYAAVTLTKRAATRNLKVARVCLLREREMVFHIIVSYFFRRGYMEGEIEFWFSWCNWNKWTFPFLLISLFLTEKRVAFERTTLEFLTRAHLMEQKLSALTCCEISCTLLWPASKDLYDAECYACTSFRKNISPGPPLSLNCDFCSINQRENYDAD